jgi:hypothetical protein
MSDSSPPFNVHLEDRGGGLTILRVSFADEYPSTLFRNLEWSWDKSLVLILMSTLKSTELFIHAFYSKAGSSTTQPNIDEQKYFRNVGTLALLTILRVFPVIDDVKLEASGGFAWYDQQVMDGVQYLGDGDLWTHARTYPFPCPSHFLWEYDSIEHFMYVAITNHRLIQYYIRRGFQIEQYSDPSVAVLHGKASHIKHACQQILKTDCTTMQMINMFQNFHFVVKNN